MQKQPSYAKMWLSKVESYLKDECMKYILQLGVISECSQGLKRATYSIECIMHITQEICN